jgi:hypothetical protein
MEDDCEWKLDQMYGRKWPILRESLLSQHFPEETEGNPSVTFSGLRRKTELGSSPKRTRSLFIRIY